MKFSELLASAAFDNGRMTVTIPQDWAQGRTAYGGLTAAFGAHCAEEAIGSLPPLRSAQVSFVGPAAGDVTVTAEVLRQGKSTTFVQADVTTQKGLATRCMLVYGAGRESSVTMTDLQIPDVPRLDDLEPMVVTPLHPAFLKGFDIRPAAGGMPFMGTKEHHMTWWSRHRDETAWDTEIGLLAISDVTPPAAASLMETLAPVSSVNWHIDLLSDDLSTEEGWYLLHTRADAAGDGWSGQDMAVWSRDGRPLIAARQTVVIFS